MTSVRGQDLMDRAFPELTAKSSLVLVVARSDGRLSYEDKEAAARLADAFQPNEGEKSPVLKVMSIRDARCSARSSSVATTRKGPGGVGNSAIDASHGGR